jgi:hypothetical protein
MESLNYNDGMLALRFAGLLAVAVWFGGLLTLGTIVAPALFEELAARQVADHRVIAGALFGEMLRRFHFVSYGCAGVILVSLVARAILGPRPRRFGLRIWVASAMLAVAVFSGSVLSSRIERLRQEIGGSPSSLREDDPRRIAFDRLHTQSTALLLVPLIGSVVLLVPELKD